MVLDIFLHNIMEPDSFTQVHERFYVTMCTLQNALIDLMWPWHVY